MINKLSSLLFLMFFILLATSLAIEPWVLPNTVNDYAEQINKRDEERLTEKIDSLWPYAQIVITTLNSTKGDDPLLLANKLGEFNGVGAKEKDNGIVILYVVDKQEMAMAVGRGIESQLNDAKVGRNVRNGLTDITMIDAFYGFSIMLEDIEKEIVPEIVPVQTNKTVDTQIEQARGWFGWFIFIILIIIISTITYFMAKKGE